MLHHQGYSQQLREIHMLLLHICEATCGILCPVWVPKYARDLQAEEYPEVSNQELEHIT